MPSGICPVISCPDDNLQHLVAHPVHISNFPNNIILMVFREGQMRLFNLDEDETGKNKQDKIKPETSDQPARRFD
jgi:hypothetical protein